MLIFTNMDENPDIQGKYQLCMRIFKMMFGHHDFKDRPIFLKYSNKMKVKAGSARHSTRTIKLNKRLMLDNPDQLLETFTHELCHIIARDIFGKRIKSHGPEWRSLMELCGYKNPSRCHNLDVSKYVKRFTVYCDCGPKQLGPIRYKRIVNKTGAYRCRKCKTKLKIVS